MMAPVVDSTPVQARLLRAVPGLAVAVVIGAVATAAGTAWPVLGAPVFAVIAGALLSPLLSRRRPWLGPGVGFAKGTVAATCGGSARRAALPAAGRGGRPHLAAGHAGHAGVLRLFLAWLVGRGFLYVSRDLRTLVGVGTAICGASAIAAVTPTIRAKNPEHHLRDLDDLPAERRGCPRLPADRARARAQPAGLRVFAGTAVNDTSSVVAAAASYGSAAADHAVVVKLVRTLMIIPVVIGLSVLVRRRDRADGAVVLGGVGRRLLGLVPWFLIGFGVIVAVHSAGLIPEGSQGVIRRAAVFLIATALAAIGLSTDLGELRRTGPAPPRPRLGALARRDAEQPDSHLVRCVTRCPKCLCLPGWPTWPRWISSCPWRSSAASAVRPRRT